MIHRDLIVSPSPKTHLGHVIFYIKLYKAQYAFLSCYINVVYLHFPLAQLVFILNFKHKYKPKCIS